MHKTAIPVFVTALSMSVSLVSGCAQSTEPVVSNKTSRITDKDCENADGPHQASRPSPTDLAAHNKLLRKQDDFLKEMSKLTRDEKQWIVVADYDFDHPERSKVYLQGKESEKHLFNIPEPLVDKVVFVDAPTSEEQKLMMDAHGHDLTDGVVRGSLMLDELTGDVCTKIYSNSITPEEFEQYLEKSEKKVNEVLRKKRNERIAAETKRSIPKFRPVKARGNLLKAHWITTPATPTTTTNTTQ